jgi:hypothetical protein
MVGITLAAGYADSLPSRGRTCGDIAHNRSDGQRVEIAKSSIGAGAVILVADVASTDDRHLVVRSKRFVAHAAIDARKVGDEIA